MRLTGGLRRPKDRIPGADVAGFVEAIGKAITRFQPGDAVFGRGSGTFAELVLSREGSLIHKPDELTFEQAAAIPVAAISALQALRDKGRVEPGEAVLVTGASGGVGTFAVQIAKAFGAEVTAAGRPASHDLLRSLGADHVIDSTGDLATAGSRYDLIIDVSANHSLLAYRRLLRPAGKLVVVGAPNGRWLAPVIRVLMAVVLSRLGRRRFIPFLAKPRQEDLVELVELVGSGRLRPVIDRQYSLAEAADAVRHLETGHPLGKVVITV